MQATLPATGVNDCYSPSEKFGLLRFGISNYTWRFMGSISVVISRATIVMSHNPF